MTSGAAKAMHHLGFDMGDDLLPANTGNPHGYYEHRRLVELNEYILRALGASWSDPPSDMAVFRSVPDFVDMCADYIASRGQPPWGMKDPRMLPLWPIWLAAFDRFDFDLVVAAMWRDRQSIADSLARRDGTPHDVGLRIADEYHRMLRQVTA